jgi:hypothetical protein
MPLPFAQAVADILHRGYASVSLAEDEAARLEEAFDAGVAFLSQPVSVKERHVSADVNHGYRPFMRQSPIDVNPSLHQTFHSGAPKR